mmetsp:Transcript_70505/g.129888  ORF Transcript_70505/g.129888 Transcript_70505/m.129888 type:complete len:575 (-) Transcript_70505:46-1770(-)
MMKSVVVLLALAAFCVARRVDPFSPGVVDSETQDTPVDTVYQPTSIAFQDYQGMMSEEEAKEILGEKLLSNLEEIGVKEVLRENGMEHISESDADRIVTAAEELVGDQIDGGTKVMVGKSEAEEILRNYNEKLQEIGAEKVLESLASVGSMFSDSSSQSMPGDAVSQADRVVDLPKGMVQESSSQNNMLWEKVLDSIEHPHASSLDKKTAQDQEVKKSVGHFSDSLIEDNAHKSIKDRELARETPRKMAGNHGSQQANREGLLQRAKHRLAHIMHMDGSQSHPHHVEEAPEHVSQSEMPKKSGHYVSHAFHNYRKHSLDGKDKMIANIGAKKIVSVANTTSAHDQYGFGKTIEDFTDIVHNIGSEKSKALYLDLLSSLSEHHAEKDGRSSAVDSGVAGGAFEAMEPEPSLAPMFLPSFLQVEQSVHKANGTSKVIGHAVSGKNDVVNISSNVTSKDVSDKMHEHAVSGAKEVAAPSAKTTTTKKEKIASNSTGMSKAVTNDSHGHAGGRDVTANATSFGAKSMDETKTIFHNANLSAHAVSAGENISMAENRVNKAIHMHQISEPGTKQAESHA